MFQGVSRVCVPQLAGLSTVAGVDVDVDVVRLHSRAARCVWVGVVCGFIVFDGVWVFHIAGVWVFQFTGVWVLKLTGVWVFVFVSLRLCVTMSLCHDATATLRRCTLS